MTINQASLDQILDYLDLSLSNIAKDTFANSEFHMETNDLREFLSAQYDIRLDNLLQKQNSGIHHLESGMKNKTIQRKQILLDRILMPQN